MRLLFYTANEDLSDQLLQLYIAFFVNHISLFNDLAPKQHLCPSSSSAQQDG